MFVRTPQFLFPARRLLSRVLHAYADFRIGATSLEKRCYKNSDSILLTFDDYGSDVEVNDILSILRAKKVKAAFFLQGDWAIKNPEAVEAIQKEGHVLGNHTFSHAVLRDLPEADIIREISSGLPGPWLRPPQGRYNDRVRKIAAKLGYVICYWSIDGRDWTGMGADEMQQMILKELHPGAVVLLHINGAHTRELLPSLIDAMRSRGYGLTDHSESWATYK
ncbi:MAG TPA: polysaccharide deacetylase family protein [Patescibacteria group bacterium]|jgi:peptidoglycan/xylan/chitin deacetylase (PgdA/CDA1 family)|nr:polysaccharide deacetylase family protein [Patescibacteria group bacterium]